jgi:2-oxoglutarate dehydrogenase E1 component
LKKLPKWEEQFVMGMARGRLNILANIFGKSTQDIFGEFEGKDYDKEYFDGDVKYHPQLINNKNREENQYQPGLILHTLKVVR